jgi:hypothetical protein
MRQFIRRNRGSVLVASAIVAASVIATTGLASGIDVGPRAEFQPIEPCRIVDTRRDGDPNQVGRLADGETVVYDVTGYVGAWWFDDQGAQGCDIPLDATAVELSFTAVEPSGAGWMRAFPAAAGPDASGATVLNKMAGFNPTNTATVAIWWDEWTSTQSGELGIRNLKSSTHLCIDVTGYYVGRDMSTTSSTPTR